MIPGQGYARMFGALMLIMSLVASSTPADISEEQVHEYFGGVSKTSTARGLDDVIAMYLTGVMYEVEGGNAYIVSPAGESVRMAFSLNNATADDEPIIREVSFHEAKTIQAASADAAPDEADTAAMIRNFKQSYMQQNRYQKRDHICASNQPRTCRGAENCNKRYDRRIRGYCGCVSVSRHLRSCLTVRP